MTHDKKKKTIGTRAQVWHGNAEKTSGGLHKKDLMKNKAGKIVSKKLHQRGLKWYKANKEYFDSKRKRPFPH